MSWFEVWDQNGILEMVYREFNKAQNKFPPFNSSHEGYAVLKEEVDELWQEVKHGTKEAAREEAIQVAAMALRFLNDIK
jgi:NTP pyrophosphatase (non-canonical NTP hydrolase)